MFMNHTPDHTIISSYIIPNFIRSQLKGEKEESYLLIQMKVSSCKNGLNFNHIHESNPCE